MIKYKRLEKLIKTHVECRKKINMTLFFVTNVYFCKMCYMGYVTIIITLVVICVLTYCKVQTAIKDKYATQYFHLANYLYT